MSLRVSTMISSPILINMGTLTTAPVSSVAGFEAPPDARAGARVTRAGRGAREGWHLARKRASEARRTRRGVALVAARRVDDLRTTRGGRRRLTHVAGACCGWACRMRQNCRHSPSTPRCWGPQRQSPGCCGVSSGARGRRTEGSPAQARAFPFHVSRFTFMPSFRYLDHVSCKAATKHAAQRRLHAVTAAGARTFGSRVSS
jgi:hypothetical protein